MAKLSDLTAHEKTSPIPIPGGSVDVTYRPELITFDLLDQVQGADGFDDLAKICAEIIVKWDVQDNAGKDLPINQKGLRQVPLEFVRDVLQSVIQGNLPGEGTGGRSGRG